ncbi:DUF5134 domain-containing protein [Streptomyces sp. SID2888]|uniref:DUF5134 domain-containing protein n=1 Tax=Streptomyces sp. SID2888 TaxID=2690256 RepID=UPI001368A40B|nr:DUF5134 domain-containing protein [Streptomyces sp. SID2888]
MIAASGLRWLLSAVFAVPLLHGLWSAAAHGRTVAPRVDHALHAVMGLFMIAMVWPWGMDLPSDPQIVLFTAGALWFACTAPLRVGSAGRARAALAALPHVLMMGAMAWMVAVMDSDDMAAGHGGGSGMGDMPGMHMAGSSATAAMSLTGTGQRLTAVLLAVLLAAVALRELTRAFDLARTAPAVEPAAAGRNGVGALGPACHAAMGLGMAVMFVLLV